MPPAGRPVIGLPARDGLGLGLSGAVTRQGTVRLCYNNSSGHRVTMAVSGPVTLTPARCQPGRVSGGSLPVTGVGTVLRLPVPQATLRLSLHDPTREPRPSQAEQA